MLGTFAVLYPLLLGGLVVECLLPHENCLKTGRLQHSDNNCYPPLSDVPCTANQRFVMDDAGRGVCMDLTCKDNNNRFSQDKLMYKGKCENLFDSDICKGNGRLLMLNVKGEGVCVCGDGWVEGPKGKCSLLYTRGHCPSQQILVSLISLAHSPQLREREYSCSMGNKCVAASECSGCNMIKEFESMFFGMNNSPMPSTCSKKGQKQFCCPKNAAETPKDEVKYYMNRMMDAPKGFGKCVTNICKPGHTIYPLYKNSTAECFPAEKNLDSCTTDIILSRGIVQCKPDNFLDLGPIEENPCNSKTSFSAITGGCINKFGVIGVTEPVKKVCLLKQSQVYVEDGLCYEEHIGPCDDGYVFAMSTAGAGFCRRQTEEPSSQTCPDNMSPDYNFQGDLICLCKEYFTRIPTGCQYYNSRATCTGAKQRLVTGADAIRSGRDFPCAQGFACKPNEKKCKQHVRVEKKLDSDFNETSTFTYTCREDGKEGVCCPTRRVGDYFNDNSKFILSRMEVRMQDPGVCIETDCTKDYVHVDEQGNLSCKNTPLLMTFRTGYTSDCNPGFYSLRRGRCIIGWGR